MTTTASMTRVIKIEATPYTGPAGVCQLEFWDDNKSLILITLTPRNLDLLESSLQAFHIPDPGPEE